MPFSTLEFDFVIVGAGSAGCVLANRLSADGTTTVALLEAGGTDRSAWIHIPVGYFKTIHNPRYDWCYRTEPDAGINGRTLKWPRGKLLGGSSSINGLLYVRGQAEDYAGWAAEGCTGWGYEDVLPFFRRSENQVRGADAYHGCGGPLQVSDMSFRRPICDDFITAVNQTGTPLNPDINGPSAEGTGYFQLTAYRGRRCSTATAFLKPARRRGNLSIYTHALAERIGFEGQRARTVQLRHNGGRRLIRARREIVLCGGAINSPQLLQLSGIGPGRLLQQHGIPVLKDSPDVGSNLQDHLQLRTVYKTNHPNTLNDELATSPQKAVAGLQYLLTRSGPLSMAASQAYAFCRTRYSQNRPDVQFHFQPLSADSPGEGLHRFSAITASVCQLRPESRGQINIRSNHPADHPRIVPNYLSTEHDQRVAIECIRLTRRIMQAPAMRKHIASEYLPDPAATDDEALLHQAREIANTIYHPTGTCRMGNDARAVTDPKLRVNGVRGLRVVDASIMPTIVSGNTNAPTIMIAEKAAHMIMAEA